MLKKHWVSFAFLLSLFVLERPSFAMDWSQIKWDDKPFITIKLHGVPRGVTTSSDWSLEARQMDGALNDTEVRPQTTQSTGNNELRIVAPSSIKPRLPDNTMLSSSVSEKMSWPVSGKVSSKYGKRGRRRHVGIDIPMAKGSAIFATEDGVVADVSNTKDGRLKGYGNVVILRHDQQISTLYAHCDTIKVKRGQSIKKGDLIGYVGRTGRATTNLLHFEVRKANKPLDPLNFLSET